MAAALSVALLMLTGMIPALGYVGPMLASVILIPVFNNFGRRAAVLTYVVTALLILILGADKEAAFFYIFFGYYPAAKPLLDKIAPAFLRRLLKFLRIVSLPGEHIARWPLVSPGISKGSVNGLLMALA